MKANKDLLRAEYTKVWKTQGMIDYCTNRISHMAQLENGIWFCVGKERIATRFCFGESGYDADDARDMAHHARTSFDYFTRENNRVFDEILSDLNEALSGNGTQYPALRIGDNNLCEIGFARWTEIINAFGGGKAYDEMIGRTVSMSRDGKYYLPTKRDIETMIEVYEEAAEAHRKKVAAYLKRYGLSKVHSWTYWRDA